MKIKRFLAALAIMTIAAASLSGCSGKSEKTDSAADSESTADISSEAEAGEEAPESDGKTIRWLSDYDLNPSGGDERSVALALYEDVYGGKIEWVPTTRDTKYDDLAACILSGDPVDMFPYDPSVFPSGAVNSQFKPLDDYIDLDDELWAGIKDTADKMAYKGAHYVIPYSIDDPVCLVYSRKTIKDEELEDPAELYKNGKWDWDAFMSMMKTFKENEGDETRYGCAGWIGPALVQSSGQPFVDYDGMSFKNNIENPAIEKAELVLEEISSAGLYDDSEWYSYFPNDNSVLFLAAEPWVLGESNGRNEDADLFIVPFPKAPDSDGYYLSCSFGAKMLLANSENGDAVADFIRCERIAATEEKYKSAEKKFALKEEILPEGIKKAVTEEQYDMIQSLRDPANITPVFDFGFGMGEKMSKETYDYETRGAMLNLTDSLVSGYEGSPSEWKELRDAYKGVLDEEIKKYN